jgi:hypothetical protein
VNDILLTPEEIHDIITTDLADNRGCATDMDICRAQVRKVAGECLLALEEIDCPSAEHPCPLPEGGCAECKVRAFVEAALKAAGEGK